MNDQEFYVELEANAKEYCDANEIRANWFKLDRELSNYLLNLAGEEGKDSNGNFDLEDAKILGVTMYAILKYYDSGYISKDLEECLNRKGMKLSKMAFKHGVELIEEARAKIAKNRINGALGGRPSNN